MGSRYSPMSTHRSARTSVILASCSCSHLSHRAPPLYRFSLLSAPTAYTLDFNPSRRRTAAVRRWQRFPSNGNVSFNAGANRSSRACCNLDRARWSRVLTVSNSIASTCAVSSVLKPSTCRSMNTSRNDGGNASIALSSIKRISPSAASRSGSACGAPPGNWMISPMVSSSRSLISIVSRRPRNRPCASCDDTCQPGVQCSLVTKTS
jgi:hypothetical protein